MAKVYFYYGCMNSGKTIDACRAAYNYEEQGLNPLCLSPAIDNRAGELVLKDGFLRGKWSSRIGLEKETYAIKDNTLIIDYMQDIERHYEKSFDVIIIDEAQFLTKEQVEELFIIAHKMRIPVICYGLLTTFKTTFFEGSKRLVELGAKLKEIKGVDSNGKKTIFNAKIVNDKIVKSGLDVEIGDAQYVPMSYLEFYIRDGFKKD